LHIGVDDTLVSVILSLSQSFEDEMVRPKARIALHRYQSIMCRRGSGGAMSTDGAVAAEAKMALLVGQFAGKTNGITAYAHRGSGI
jgi:hypothetical protein